jgi:hypothetical protein
MTREDELRKLLDATLDRLRVERLGVCLGDLIEE